MELETRNARLLVARVRAGSLYLIFIGLLLCAAGVLFAWLMWRSFDRASAQRNWVETECTILEARVDERRIASTVETEYAFAVVYGYTHEGEAYTSERYSLRGSPWSSSRARAEKLVEDYPDGSVRRCYLDPEDPESAVLKRDSRAPGYSLWFPLIFVVGGIGVIVGALRGEWRRAKSEERPGESREA